MYIDVTKKFNSSKFKTLKICHFRLTYINLFLYSIFFICWSCFIAFFACIVDVDRWVGVVVEYQIVYQFNDSHL